MVGRGRAPRTGTDIDEERGYRYGPLTILLIIIAVTFVTELAVMLLLLEVIPGLSDIATVFLDGFLLIIVLFPVLYLLTYRPLFLEIRRRERVEAALRASEARFRIIFQGVAVGTALVDLQGRPLETNPALQTILGYSEAELRRMSFTEFTYPADRQTDRRLFEEILAGKRDHYSMEKRYVRKDGQVIWGRLTVSAIRDNQGTPVFLVGMVEDITERRRAEEALRQQRRQLQELAEELETVIDTIPTGVAITDADHRIVRANEAFARLMAVPIETLEGKRVSEITGNPFGDDLRRRVWATGDAVSVTSLEYTFPGQPGRPSAYWDFAIAPIHAADGSIIQLLTSATDVTQYVQSRQQVEFERARWLTTLNTLPQPAILVDTNGMVIMANRTAELTWRQVLQGHRWLDIVEVAPLLNPTTRQHLPVTARPIPRALRGEDVRDVEVVLQRADGTTVPMLLHASPIRLEGKVVGAVQVGQDLTKLKEADRVKDRFLATVSHDLRSPLSAIEGWAEAAQHMDDPAVIREALESILRSVAVQRGLINDLLDAAAVAAGRLRIEPVQRDIRPNIRDVVAGARADAASRDITLTAEVPEEALEACVDPLRFQQILGNLLGNALKFTPQGGHVAVRAFREGDYAVLTVHDTGQGIPPDLLPHIFERFYQPTSPPPGAHGLGLGLSIVRSLVELHGGQIIVQSGGPGQGSTFTVRLPSACPPEPRDREPR